MILKNIGLIKGKKMSGKKIVDLFVVCLTTFVGLFCRVDTCNFNFNSCDLIYINTTFATVDNEDLFSESKKYKYNDGGGRENLPDETLIGGESVAEKAGWIDKIPGIGSFIVGFNYIDFALKTSDLDLLGIIKNVLKGDITSILMTVGNIVDLLNPNPGDSKAALGFDKVFMSNLYCRAQRIYEEDKDLISKSNVVSKGGLDYPMFPIYPLSIGINKDTGLCDLESGNLESGSAIAGHQFKDYFKQIMIADGSARKTKCSFSYSPTSKQCIDQLSNPLIISYEAQAMTISIICTVASAKSAKTSAGKADDAKQAAENAKQGLKQGQKRFDEAADKCKEAGKKIDDFAEKAGENGKKLKDAYKEASDALEEMKDATGEALEEAQKKLKKAQDKISNIAEELGDEGKDIAKNANKSLDALSDSTRDLKDLEDAAEQTANEARRAQQIAAKDKHLKEKHMGEIGTAVLSIFTDERLIYDPVSLLGILTVGYVIEFIGNTITAIVPNILNLPELVQELACVGAGVIGFEVFKGVAEGVIAGISSTNYGNAKKAILNYNFCGYDWLTYQKTVDGKYFKKGVYAHSYYKKVYDCINPDGAVDNECGAILDNYACSSTDANFCTEGKNAGSNKITKYSRHIKNKVFREYTYGGKEYDAGTIEQNITKENKENDNRAVRFFQNLGKDITTAVNGQKDDMSALFSGDGYDPIYCIDPRTPEQKGFETLTQRYYMRGNAKANFACSRFVYDGKSACILHSSKVADEDKNKMKQNGDYFLLPDNDKELINKYSRPCKEMFAGARDCCKQRSRHLICLVKKPQYDSKKCSVSTGKTDKDGNEICLDKKITKEEKSTFCFANVVEEYSAENREGGSNLMAFVNAVQNDGDFFKWTCELDGTKFEATKRAGTNQVCVFSYGFCPYDFKLNAGLNYKATYCDADYYFDGLDANNIVKRTTTHLNVDDCRKGIFGADTRENYKSNTQNSSDSLNFTSHVFNEVYEDMKGFNDSDFKTIYDLTFLNGVMNNGYSGLSNDKMLLLENMFGCDARFEAECKEIIRNTIINGYTKSNIYDGVNKEIKRFNVTQEFIDDYKTSAYGQIKNFCQYMAHCVEVEEERLLPNTYNYSTLFMDSSCNGGGTNSSRNLFQGNTGGLPKQLSAPIVECIHESLNNLVNGVSGSSLCTEGHEVNDEGFCDSDTEESVAEAVKTGNKKFLEKYDTAPNSNAIIIKGYPLPDNYNPFLRMQKSFIRVIRAALTLFLVGYFYKLFFSGKIGNFTSPENISKLIFNLFKFSIVIWLIFYNGWQQGIYKKIVKFSTDAYTFVNTNFSKAISTPNNQILHLKHPKIINIVKQDPVDTDKLVNYRVCYRYDYANNIKFGAVNENRGVCERGFSRKNNSEIVIRFRGKSEPKQVQNEDRLIISSNQEISALISFIDQYNSTHAEKLYTRGLEGVNISVNDEYLTGGEYEKEYVWNKYYDGCYFDPTEYKEGKEYLSIFDTLDCKMIRYLGYSTDKLVPNLIIFSLMLVIPNYLFQDTFIAKMIAGLGSMLFGALMSFMFLMFNILIKTVYIFLSSFFTLSILIFVSPIILPLMFYERTKKMVDTWLGMVMDSVVKPVFSMSMMMIYINIIDKILLRGAMFIKHDFRGRGPSLYCYEGAISSFVCVVNSLLNGMGGTGFFALLERLFNNFLPFLADILIVVLLFMMSDSVLSTIDNVVKGIFQLGKTAAVSNMGKGGVADSEGQSTEDVILGKSTGKRDKDGKLIREGGAMGLGKSMNTFRSDYLAKAPGAALDSFINTTTAGGAEIYNKGFNGSVKDAIPYSKLDSVREAKKGTKVKTFFGDVGKVLGNGVRATGRGAAYTGRLMGYVGRGLGRARNFAGGVDDWARNISSRGKNFFKWGVEDIGKKMGNISTRHEYDKANSRSESDKKWNEFWAGRKKKKIDELEGKGELTERESKKLEKLKNKYEKWKSRADQNQKDIDTRNGSLKKNLFKFNTEYDEEELNENLLKLEKREQEEEKKRKASAQANRESNNENNSGESSSSTKTDETNEEITNPAGGPPVNQNASNEAEVKEEIVYDEDENEDEDEK